MDEPVVPAPENTAEGKPSRAHHVAWATVAVFTVLIVLLTATGRMESLAQNFLKNFNRAPVVEEVTEIAAPAPRRAERGSFTFKDLDLHPDLIHRPYTAGPMLGEGSSSSRLVNAFRDLLALYEERQGIDDNFTIRVVDNRSGELLEVFVLEQERAKYEETGKAHWHSIDQLRRQHTRQLVDKYVKRGIPRPAVTVKWGRANQVREARERDLPFIEHEVRLARYLGLSLLPTEIGTVETFNQDRLVSSVGARSRYQMMPYILRQNGIHHYSLRTASGRTVSVFEEWHPLLAMEPAFKTLRGYINAVGHEIPGISAYHTGPGNIYMVLRKFLTAEPDLFNPSSTVVDAYIWAVTEGFDTVSKGTSFGSYSRGYVASAYGALRATEDLPVDTSHTVLAERVQLKPGQQIYLSQLLRALQEQEQHLRWNQETKDRGSFYNRFRHLNPHIGLPEPTDSTTVPVPGDVRLVSEVDRTPVRFFLPLGAAAALAATGLDIFDEEATFRFDRTTYGNPSQHKTMWDFQYDELVEDIGRFGFTRENRSRLFELEERFRQLYRANPSHYRKTQLDIIRTHKGIWSTGVWENLASATSAAAGRFRPPARPPSPLDGTPASTSPVANLGQ